MRYINMILDKLKMVYIMLMLLIPKKEGGEPVRLQKKEQNEPIRLTIGFDYKVLIFFVVVLTLFILLIYYIYKTGSLESTTYYYRLRNV